MSPTRPRRAAVLPSMSATLRLVAVVASLLFATSLLFCNERGCSLPRPTPDVPAGRRGLVVWARGWVLIGSAAVALINRDAGHCWLREMLQLSVFLAAFTGNKYFGVLELVYTLANASLKPRHARRAKRGLFSAATAWPNSPPQPSSPH